MAKPFDFSTALMVPRQTGPKAKARAEQAAIDKRRRELVDEKQTFDARKVEQFQNEQRRRSYANIDQMQFEKQNPIQYKNTVPAVELSQAPLQRPIEDAVGGPEGKPAPWANDPVIEDDQPPAASAKPWANDPVVDDGPTDDIDSVINYAASSPEEAAQIAARQIDEKYAAQPSKPLHGSELAAQREDDALKDRLAAYAPAGDPLAKPGAMARKPDLFDAAQAGEIHNDEQPWNEQLANFLGKGVDFLFEPVNSRDAGPNDPVPALSKALVEPMARFPEALARDPVKTLAQDYNPIYQTGMGYKDVESAAGKAMQGDFAGAGVEAVQGLGQMAGGALGLMGLKGGPKAPAPLNAKSLAQAERMAANTKVPPSVVPKPPPVSKSAVRDSRKTLQASLLPGSVIRPQAWQAINRILTNSGVPRDRIDAWLAKLPQSLPSLADGSVQGSARAPTVAQFLEREFADEFPEIRQNLRTVLLERRLSRTAGDRSPTTVRDTVQDMRGSQVPYLEESLNKNLGDTARTGTRQQVAENLKQIGEEGYKPIVSQTATPERATAIQSVLTGPGMNELGRPLRQIAAGEGIDIEQMIAQRPIEAAHWMQHKARLLAEENGDTALGNAYGKMRDRILKTIDDLTAPDGRTYAQIRKEYGDEAGIKGALTAGDRFGAIVRNPDGANQFIEKFKEATPEQQAAQLASIRDWAGSKLRGGGEEGAARMTELQNIAVLDTLDKLGPQGKALADDIRAVRDEEQFLGSFYPKSESATASNTVAREQGPDIYSRSAKGSAGMTAAADGTLMAAGATHAPLLTALRQGPKLYRGMMQPKTATREDMTRLLMARPGARPKGETVASPPTPPTRTIPPRGPEPAKIGQRQNVANVTTQDGRVYEVKAEVFKDRDATVMSPSYPSNIADDLAGAIKHQRSTLTARKSGMDVVNDAPRAPDWATQNPQEWGDVQRQVGERFLGMVNSTPGPHVLALVDGVDLNSLATLIEDGLPKTKVLMKSADNGEFAVVDRFQPLPEQFQPSPNARTPNKWETYSSLRWNQKQGILPPPADWANAKPAPPSSPSTVTPFKPAQSGSLIDADAISRIASGKTVPTSAELDDALKGLREAEFADLVRQFGGDKQKAEKFRSLWRQAESAPTRQEADLLDAQRQKLIEGMPDIPAQEFVDEYALRQLRDAFREIENGNAAGALTDSMTDLPTLREVQSGQINSRAQAALAILRKATQEARLQGADPAQMLDAALTQYGRRFSDPADADFMVGEVKKLAASFGNDKPAPRSPTPFKPAPKPPVVKNGDKPTAPKAEAPSTPKLETLEQIDSDYANELRQILADLEADMSLPKKLKEQMRQKILIQIEEAKPPPKPPTRKN